MDPIITLNNVAAWLVAAVIIALIGADLCADVRRLIRGRNVVLVGILVWYLLEAIVLPASMAGRIADEEGRGGFEIAQALYNWGLLYVALASVSFVVVYQRSTPWNFEHLNQRLYYLEDPRFLWKIVVIGAVIGFTPILIFGGIDLVNIGQSIFRMRSGNFILSRGRYGGVREALLELQMFVRAVAPFAFILLLEKDTSFPKRALCMLVVVYPIFYALATGTRNALFIALAPMVGVFYWKASALVQKRMIYFLLVPAALLGFKLSEAMVVARNTGDFSWETGDEVKYVGYEMFSPMLFIMSRVPSEQDFLYGYSYFIQMINPIPRALWPDKPKLETGLFLAIMEGNVDERSGEAFLTSSPGILGEMYFNFGWIGIIVLSGLGGWLVRSWDTLADRFSRFPAIMTVFSMGLAVLLFFGRSVNITMVYGLIAFFILIFLLSSSRPAFAEAG